MGRPSAVQRFYACLLYTSRCVYETGPYTQALALWDELGLQGWLDEDEQTIQTLGVRVAAQGEYAVRQPFDGAVWIGSKDYREAKWKDFPGFAHTLDVYKRQLDDRALCIVFAKLLENAVEACGRIAEGEKCIRLSSRLEHGVLTITMDNSFDGKFAKQKEKFLSSKRSGFGIGISSIQAVAKAHQGDARFEAEGTVFRSSVYCRLQIN